MIIKEYYKTLKVLESHNRPFTKEERLLALNDPLFVWYQENKRVLPWREKPTPYRVWISEIMLQQTRVEAVKPYFERFMSQVPDVKTLARIEDEKLLKLWEGLGYYNRARNLKKAAQSMETHYGGQLPDTYEDLLTLTGIGSYTAGAVASIAYGIPVPAVDGNVLRVISRVLASREDITKQSVKTQMEQDLKKSMPKDRPAEFNQSLMEIGATICIPNGQAKCSECPISFLCLSFRQDIVMELPIKTPKKPRKIEQRTIFVIEDKSRISLHKRLERGLLAGLYELPNVLGHVSPVEAVKILGFSNQEIIIEPLPAAKHIFSHVEWHMIGYRIVVKEGQFPDQYLTILKDAVKFIYPLPNAFRAYMEQIQF